MKRSLLVAALMAAAALAACHRPDPGKLTPEQQQVYKGS